MAYVFWIISTFKWSRVTIQIRSECSNSQSTAEGDCSEGTFSGANGNRGDRGRLHQITRSRPPLESVSHPYKFLELYTSSICPASATYRELRNFDGSEIVNDWIARVFAMIIHRIIHSLRKPRARIGAKIRVTVIESQSARRRG